MSDRQTWRVEALDPNHHQREGFSCGTVELDRYFKAFASQDVRRDLARVFVACEPDANRIIGYYSLGAASFLRDSLPADQARRLPRYPLPAVLLGRLAVDRSMQGKGLGAHLLMDALSRVLLASQTLAVYAITIEAKDEPAAAFYRKFGFIDFPDNPLRLFLPLDTVRMLFDS